MLVVLGLGLVVGVILALTGAGGGILAVPLLVFGIQMAPHPCKRDAATGRFIWTSSCARARALSLNLPKPRLIDIAVPANRNLGLPHGA
jgi:hypothetical protein